MTDQIRLAEAMGWIYTKGYRESPMSGRHPYNTWHKRGEDKLWDYLPFDPFTDANDDYAVRDHFMASDKADDFVTALIRIIADRESEGRPYVYHVACIAKGDYARAALKVISDE